MAAPRLRLFVKKRGSRRTGSPWVGVAAEALLFAGLIAVGAYGLYWLIDHLIYTEEAGWWPWFAMLIPLALCVYGVIGLVAFAWQNTTSTERRAAVVQKAAEELLGAQGRTTGPTLPAVPPIETVIDSPGTHLAHRLPIDAASGWVSFTMAAVCVAWNALVGIFVVQVIAAHRAGNPNWLLTWLMIPFVLAGAWTIFALVRQVLLNIVMGTTRVEVSQHPLYPGGRFQGFVSQTGRLHVRWMQIQLVCDEQAVYQQGTDTRRATSRVFRETLFNQRKFDIRPEQAFESTFEFTIPSSAMHSFVSSHNAIVWSLVARGRTARWGEFERRFPIFVYPLSVAQQPVLGPMLATMKT